MQGGSSRLVNFISRLQAASIFLAAGFILLLRQTAAAANGFNYEFLDSL